MYCVGEKNKRNVHHLVFFPTKAQIRVRRMHPIIVERSRAKCTNTERKFDIIINILNYETLNELARTTLPNIPK